MARFYFDNETDGLLDELTVVHCLVLKEVDDGEVNSCSEHHYESPTEGVISSVSIHYGATMLQEATEIIGHNIINFDIPAMQKVYPWFAPVGLITDTLVLSRLAFPNLYDQDVAFNRTAKARGREQLPPKRMGSHSLEAWGLRLGTLKGDFGKTTDWGEWTPEMQTYCEQDVTVTEVLYKFLMAQKLSPQAIKLEMDFAKIIALQSLHGFHFDEAAAIDLYQTLLKSRIEITKQLVEAFPPEVIEEEFIPKVNNAARGYVKGVPFIRKTTVEFNASSRHHIARRLRKMGWEPTEFTPKGEAKIDETVLSKLPYPEAAVLARHFLIEKRIGQLAEGDQAWLKQVKRGRIHGSVNTNGAVTGRCTHSRPNVAQVPKVGSPFGAECRGLFGVPLGTHKQVGVDLAGLELRCLAHFMARYDGGEYGRILLNGDVHWQNVLAMGLTDEDRDDHKLLHKLLRDGAKTFIYAYLYGAGDVKIGSIVSDIIRKLIEAGLPYQDLAGRYFAGATDPDEKALGKAGKKLKESFLAKTPALRRLREDVAAAVKKRGHLIGLDGRKLHVRSPHAALNTLLQSAGALIAKMATIIAYNDIIALGYVWGEDFAQVAHVHDEMQFEVRSGLEDIIGETVVTAMQKVTQVFNFTIQIDGEFKTGNNWKDCH